MHSFPSGPCSTSKPPQHVSGQKQQFVLLKELKPLSKGQLFILEVLTEGVFFLV